VASLRGGVGRYVELSPPNMEADVDAVFGGWMVVRWGDDAVLFNAGEGSAIINGSVITSIGTGFLRVIRKGAGGGGGMRVEMGSVDGNGREGRREGGIEDESASVVGEEYARDSRG